MAGRAVTGANRGGEVLRGSSGPWQAGDSYHMVPLPRAHPRRIPGARGTEGFQSPSSTSQDWPSRELLLWAREPPSTAPQHSTASLGLPAPRDSDYNHQAWGSNALCLKAAQAVTFLSLCDFPAPTTSPMFTMGRSPLGLGTKRSLDVGRAGLSSWSRLTSASESSRSCTRSKCCLKQRCPWEAGAGKHSSHQCP